MSNKSGNVLLYDSLDKPNADKQPITRKDWREDIPKYIFLSFLILFGFILFLLAIYGMITSYNDSVVYVGWFIIIIYLLSISYLIIGRLSIYLYLEYNKSQKERLVNVFEYQTTYDQLSGVLEPYFRAMEIRMQNSLFASVQNLTYSPSNSRQELEPKQIDVDTPIVIEELPALEQLQQEGKIGRSGESILLGFEHDTQIP